MIASLFAPRRGRTVPAMLTGAVALALALAPVAAANVTVLQISSDAYANTDSQHATEVEPDTFAAGSTVVSAVQVGRVFGGGSSNIGFATSKDSGATFTNGYLPGSTVNASSAGIYAAASDPSVAYDASHKVWLISWLGLSPNGSSAVDVLVSRSTDGGFTWGDPVVVTANGHFNDKNWTVCDSTASSPFYGNCYTEYDDNSKGDLIHMSTSSDGGASWGTAETTAGRAHGIGGQPLVQPGGNVIVPIEGFAHRAGVIMSFGSSDGGASWGHPTRIAAISFHTPAGGIRAGVLPSAEIDGSGRVYVTWADCRFESGCTANDLVLSSSADGTTWSAVTRIPLDAVGSGVDHFIPGLAVAPATSGVGAHLLVTYYSFENANCTVSTCQLDVGYASSVNGGDSWSASTQLAGPMSLSWIAATSQGPMVGDYISTSFVSSGKASAAFVVANAPSGGKFDEATYTFSGGLTAVGGSVVAADRVGSGSNASLTSSSITAH
jgi:hypothetical protein